MEKKIENMTKKELIERITELQINYDSLHEQYTKFGMRTAKDIEDLKRKIYEAATAREEDIAFYKNSNAELKKKNEAIHEEAKRWKKEAVDAQAELDDLRSAIGADDSDPMSVAIWKTKYHTLKYQFDKLKDEDRKWTSANPAVQAALERKINVLEKEINKYKAQASEWEAKYEYQNGQTDCVIKDYNALNKKYTALLAEHATLSSKYDDMMAYFESRGDKKALEERIKDLIRQCDELYDKNKELDAENACLKNKIKDEESLHEQRRKDLRETVKENNALRREIRDLNTKCDRLKETINKTYGVARDADDFDDRARKCAIIFSKTIDGMIRAYNMDVNSSRDGTMAGVAKTVNTIRGGRIWLDALEESMRKFSEEAEKYIKKVGEKND